VQFNLWILGQYFAWLSFIFLIIAAYITYAYIAMRATKTFKVKWYHWVIVSIQWFVSPLIFIFMGPPALDVQIRGILGKYLGYWVTPKK
jgi:heme/copper-type cytochrome/quinol oxidase subunit 2